MIRNTIGEVEVDTKVGEAARREYVIIKVRINITKPLLHEKKINIGNYGTCWIRFMYERMPNFCYAYGMLGHGDKDCAMWKENEEQFEKRVFHLDSGCELGRMWGGGEIIRMMKSTKK